MKNILYCLFLILFCLAPAVGQEDTSLPVVIPVNGEVGPAMAAFIKRAVEENKEKTKGPIIFEIDTFGGRVDSALEIVETLLTIDKADSISYVKTKAISAGALIALSSGRLYMKTGTTIGDCAPITYSKEGVQEMGEKFQSPLRAKFRALAKRNGFPQVLAEAMVSKDKEIVQVKKDNEIHYYDRDEFNELKKRDKEKYQFLKTVVKKGELLTMDDIEAVNFSFSSQSVQDLDQLLETLDLTADSVRYVEKNWSEIMAGYLIAISPILIMIGLAGVYMELKSPGFGAPGLIGIVCLLLAFVSQYTTGLANYTELLIILAGFGLLAVEVFILPGFGIAGIAGITLIFCGMVLSLQNFTLPDPDLPWEVDIFVANVIWVMAIGICSLVLSFLAFRYILPRVSVPGGGTFLSTTLEDSHADSAETRHVRVGDTGTALSELRPSGKAQFHDQRLDVITQGDYIDKGETIQVIELSKSKIIVQQKGDPS